MTSRLSDGSNDQRQTGRLLLDDAGLPRKDGGMRFGLHLEVNSFGEQWLRQAKYLKQALGQVGIDVTLRSEDTATWLRRVYTDYDYDINEPFLGQSIDPIIGLNKRYLASQIRKGVTFVNNSFYANPVLDDLLMQGMHESDPARRGAIYKQAQQILAEDSPLIWLVDVQFVSVFNHKLHDHTTGPMGPYQAFDEAWLEK
jgi:peptide/nickel transport system substrate-binding protein